MATAAESILRAYPQADARTSEATAAELTQFLSTLTEQELAWVMDVRNGIKARCKFVPSPADLNELIADRRAKKDQFEPSSGGGYQRFTPAPWTEEDERVAAVRRTYNPFPRLSAAFDAERELLQRTFDTLFDASAALARDGHAAARLVLEHGTRIDDRKWMQK